MPQNVVPFNDLSRSLDRDRPALMRAADAVVRSGRVVNGLHKQTFESELASLAGVAFAIGVASGTDALELAMRAAMPAGKQVVLTAANAGGYSSIAARRAGFRVKYADVDASSLCLSETTVNEAIDDSVGLVVVTHLYGRLTDIRGLVNWCHGRGIRVVEDCAQSIGARIDGAHCGSLGDVGAFSFYPTKNLGAIGDGGAVVTNDPSLADHVTILREYGWREKYEIVLDGGRNSRLDELQAAFLLTRLPHLEARNARRREIACRYSAAARGGQLEVLDASSTSHSSHLAVALAPPDSRTNVRGQLSLAGVQTEVHFPIPDHKQTGLLVQPMPSLPVTEDACSRVISLPSFPELTDTEVDRVCAAIEGLTW